MSACTRGTMLCRVNPMSGTGMKQGRQTRGGRRRQEVAKTWRRRRSGEASPTQEAAALCREYAEGEQNLKEGAEKRQYTFGCTVTRQLGLGMSLKGQISLREDSRKLDERPDESESSIAVRSSKPTIERHGGLDLTDTGPGSDGCETLEGARTPGEAAVGW